MSTPLQRHEKWDRRFIDLSREISTWSHDPSTQCGAVIVDQLRRVVSTGYNGFPRQMPDSVDAYADREVKYSRIIHADMNALLFAGRPVDGCTIYTWPLLPCDRCFVHLAQAGILRYVAPRPVRPSHIERWGPIIEKTKAYAAEMGLIAVELVIKNRVVLPPNVSTIADFDSSCEICRLPLYFVRDYPQVRFCANSECDQYLCEQDGVTA